GTFHFLVRFHERRRQGVARRDASHDALAKTGPPILQAAIVASAGMLALALSQFVPTARFGILTATMLVTALLGDLVLLPALLALGCRGHREDQQTSQPRNATGRRSDSKRRPHFMAARKTGKKRSTAKTDDRQPKVAKKRTRRRKSVSA
ncbi:MAG: MMPL family transporter, partial [Planctomycetaceae bacterium]|nr:MMPL family transporter [Planctomycetaceae bacterium]